MLSTGISLILLQIFISSTVHGGISRATEGHNITLQCEFRENYKTEIIALWKKENGQRVIWKHTGKMKKANNFQNRTIAIDENLSLVIDKCKKSDQGVYVLCINGKPSCKVMLLVEKNKIRCKISRESQCSEKPPIDETGLKAGNDQKETTNSLRSIHFSAIAVATLFFLLVFLLLNMFILFIKRKDSTKNDNAELKVLHPT